MNIHDVVKQKECVDAARVPCEKAREYLAKKGLICRVKPPRPKPTPARKPRRKVTKSWFERWLESWFG